MPERSKVSNAKAEEQVRRACQLVKYFSDTVNGSLNLKDHRLQRYTFANTLNKDSIVSKACNFTTNVKT